MTGFEGIERQKVEVLIKQLGATYTDYLDQANTLLVCKRWTHLSYIGILIKFCTPDGLSCHSVNWQRH